MLELGQPNHPYDLAKVAGATLRVRRAADGETLTTLDDVERTLTADDLLICDGDDRPVGIAGIMGGADCEISATTTDVLLEMAWFDPTSISRTLAPPRPALGGVGPLREGLRPGGHRAGRRPLLPAGRRDLRRHHRARSRSTCAARCPTARRCGSAPPGSTPSSAPTSPPAGIAALLDPIGFAADGASATTTTVAVPTWRYDSATEIDVDRGGRPPPRLPQHPEPRAHRAPRRAGLTAVQHERRARAPAAVRPRPGRGAAAAVPRPGPAGRRRPRPDGHRAGQPAGGRGVRPAHRAAARAWSAAVAHNHARRQLGIGVWEIGHVFLPPPDGQVLPDEREHVAVVLAGREAPAAVEVVAGAGRAARASSSPSVAQRRARPGCTPPAAAEVLVDGVVGRHRRRDRPGRARPPRHRRAGRLPRGRPRRPATTRPAAATPTARSAGSRPATSTWPSRCPTTCRPSTSSGRSPRPTRWCGRSACSTCTGAPASPTGTGAWPSPCASRPSDRTLTDAEVAEVRARAHRRGRGRLRRHPPRLSLGYRGGHVRHRAARVHGPGRPHHARGGLGAVRPARAAACPRTPPPWSSRHRRGGRGRARRGAWPGPPPPEDGAGRVLGRVARRPWPRCAATGAFGPPAPWARSPGCSAATAACPRRRSSRRGRTGRGVVGDRQDDRGNHGRPWQALCLWSTEVIDGFRRRGPPARPGPGRREHHRSPGIDWERIAPGRAAPHRRRARRGVVLRRARAARTATGSRRPLRPHAPPPRPRSAGSTPPCCSPAPSTWAARSCWSPTPDALTAGQRCRAGARAAMAARS